MKLYSTPSSGDDKIRLHVAVTHEYLVDLSPDAAREVAGELGVDPTAEALEGALEDRAEHLDELTTSAWGYWFDTTDAVLLNAGYVR